MINRLIHQLLPILTIRQTHIELIEQLSSNSSELQQGKVLSDTAVWTRAEGLEGVFVVYQLVLLRGGPAFGEEFFGAGVILLIFMGC